VLGGKQPEPQPPTSALSLAPSGQLAEYGLLDEAALPPEYDEFCDLLFSKPEIMYRQDVNGLDDVIYALYSGGTEPDALAAELRGKGDEDLFERIVDPNSDRMLELRQQYLDYWQKIEDVTEGAFLQYSAEPLADAIAAWKAWTPEVQKNANNWANDFVMIIKRREPLTHRVYANPQASEVGQVAQVLMGLPGIGRFKFAGPHEIGTRADGVVVYCTARQEAEKVAKALNGTVREDTGRPAMTEAAGGSDSIGIGAEPASEATGIRTRLPWQGPQPKTEAARKLLPPGLGKQEDLAPEDHSFGTIRSEVIASAILHLRENRDWAEKLDITEAELFKRLVATGLKGWRRALEPTDRED
jgi:hypothetical protein